MRARRPGWAFSSFLTGLVTNIARSIEVLIRRCRRAILGILPGVAELPRTQTPDVCTCALIYG
jgi:hypothetical protein